MANFSPAYRYSEITIAPNGDFINDDNRPELLSIPRKGSFFHKYYYTNPGSNSDPVLDSATISATIPYLVNASGSGSPLSTNNSFPDRAMWPTSIFIDGAVYPYDNSNFTGYDGNNKTLNPMSFKFMSSWCYGIQNTDGSLKSSTTFWPKGGQFFPYASFGNPPNPSDNNSWGSLATTNGGTDINTGEHVSNNKIDVWVASDLEATSPYDQNVIQMTLGINLWGDYNDDIYISGTYTLI